MQANIERNFISKVLETKDFILVREQKIKSSFFSGEHRKVFDYIAEYFLKYGEVPTKNVISNQFSTYELVDNVEEPLQYWCDELRVKLRHNKLVDLTEKLGDSLENFDSETALRDIIQTSLEIQNDVILSSSVNINENTEERKELYKKRKETKGMLGISTGIRQLDYLTKGLQKEQLITLIASTSTGKTWFEVVLGCNAILNSCRVLQLVTEMSISSVLDRYDALLTSLTVAPIGYSRFKSGLLLPDEEENYYRYLDKVAPKLEPVIIEDCSGGVSFVGAKIDQYKPDLVLIDGAYLMEDERNAKEDWLRIAHITRDLHNLCKMKKIPIFINTQADSNTSKKIGPELGNIAFSRAVGQDSDIVLALFQDEQMRNDKEMLLKILKQREGILGKITMSWDFEEMNFDGIYSSHSEETDVAGSKGNPNVVEIGD